MHTAFHDPQLRQRGRASVDFVARLAQANTALKRTLDDEAAGFMAAAPALPDDLDACARQIETALAAHPTLAVQTLITDWHGRMHGRIATAAFAEITGDLAPVLEQCSHGPASLVLDPEMAAPDYWQGVDFHRTTGGWDGHAHMGYVHGEIVHKKMVARFFPGGIFGQRRAVAEMAPRRDYARILDMGCSSGHFTTALQHVFPAAQIVGVDLSPRMLEHAWRTANANGWAWQLHQKPAEATGLAASSIDLVASYILLHELPETAVRAVFAEAFRLLVPGGDVLMSDVTRYADLDVLGRWKADRAARLGGEPHWRSSAGLDLAAIARDAGFVDVVAAGLYPHVVSGRKP